MQTRKRTTSDSPGYSWGNSLSLWVGGSLHKSFPRFYLLHNAMASPHVSIFATEIAYVLPNERFQSPSFALWRAWEWVKHECTEPQYLTPGHSTSNSVRQSTLGCSTYRPTVYVVLCHHRLHWGIFENLLFPFISSSTYMEISISNALNKLNLLYLYSLYPAFMS